MPERGRFDAVLAGETRGPLALLWRTAALLPMAGYALGNAARQAGFALGLRRVRRLGVPVVSVGNLSAGGTGKTPAVIALAEILGDRLPAGKRVAVLSRGYRPLPGRPHNDEALLLTRALPDVPHIQARDRATAGAAALADSTIACIVLDDGFSHRQLARDLDIVLIDATRPFGWLELLPRGLLREPPSALRRASAAILTRSDQVPPGRLGRLRDRIRCLLPDGAPLAEAGHVAVALQCIDGSHADAPDTLAGQAVVAVSALGNPAAFHRSLAALGATVEHVISRPDHHAWTAADVAAIRANVADRLCVTTTKDAVKLGAHIDPADDRWRVLAVEFRLAPGAEADRLLAALPV